MLTLTPHQVRNYSQLPKSPVSPMPGTAIDNATLIDLCQQVCSDVQQIAPVFYPFAELQRFTGCRVTEAFTPSLWSCDESGRYTLKALKGNYPRVFCPEWHDHLSILLTAISSWALAYCSQSNYRRIIRHLFKLHGLYRVSKGGTAFAGSHTFRHAYVARYLQLEPTWEELLKDLGEKTMKAANEYVNSQFYIIPNNFKINTL